MWLCLFNCLYTRAISLILAWDCTAEEFLKCLQVHTFRYNQYPQYLLTDLGSNFMGAKRILGPILESRDVKDYMNEHGIKTLVHETIPSKASFLNSVSERLVKEVKNLIFKSIRNQVLNLSDFNLLISRVNYLVNSRPLTQKGLLGDVDSNIITPNTLIFGKEGLALNIVPYLWHDNDDDVNDPEWLPDQNLNNYQQKLKKIKTKIDKLYYEEFLHNLLIQSTDKNKRYEKKHVIELSKNDLVMIVVPNTKRAKYPIGIVVEVIKNDKGSVVEAIIRKSNGETSNYHVSSLILVQKTNEY